MNAVTMIGARSLLRAGLMDLLAAIGFAPIEEADDAGHLFSRIGAVPPAEDWLIIMLARPGERATAAVRELRGRYPSAKIVCLTPEFDLDEMRACFAAGACGYLLESISRDALRESLRLVAAGEKVFPSELAVRMPFAAATSSAADSGGAPARVGALSGREVEILRALASGQSNKLIARNLDISEATVKLYVKRLLRKAHARNRTQAALWAVATGVAPRPQAASWVAEGARRIGG
jgi:two-component system nitrate/nitrite response regulator NarL